MRVCVCACVFKRAKEHKRKKKSERDRKSVRVTKGARLQLRDRPKEEERRSRRVEGKLTEPGKESNYYTHPHERARSERVRMKRERGQKGRVTKRIVS